MRRRTRSPFRLLSRGRRRRLFGAIGGYRPFWVKYNVQVRTRDQSGMIVQEHKGKNIWLNVGRDWLLQLMSYDIPGGGVIVTGAPPPNTFHENRIGFMAVGVGGRENDSPVDQAACVALYAANPGFYGATVPTFTYDDTDTGLTGLEAPLVWNVAGGPVNQWQKPVSLVELQAPTPSTWVRYTTIFDVVDINSHHAGVPDILVSEAALFPVDLVAGNVKEPTQTDTITRALAYECFPPVTKTPALALEIQWTLKL